MVKTLNVYAQLLKVWSDIKMTIVVITTARHLHICLTWSFFPLYSGKEYNVVFSQLHVICILFTVTSLFFISCIYVIFLSLRGIYDHFFNFFVNITLIKDGILT